MEQAIVYNSLEHHGNKLLTRCVEWICGKHNWYCVKLCRFWTVLCLQVVIILTTGLQFQTLSELDIPPNSGVNFFLYNFRTDRDAECNSTIRASPERIPVERITNPLYALESCYSFLAKTHRSFMGNRTDYGQKWLCRCFRNWSQHLDNK